MKFSSPRVSVETQIPEWLQDLLQFCITVVSIDVTTPPYQPISQS